MVQIGSNPHNTSYYNPNETASNASTKPLSFMGKVFNIPNASIQDVIEKLDEDLHVNHPSQSNPDLAGPAQDGSLKGVANNPYMKPSELVALVSCMMAIMKAQDEEKDSDRAGKLKGTMAQVSLGDSLAQADIESADADATKEIISGIGDALKAGVSGLSLGMSLGASKIAEKRATNQKDQMDFEEDGSVKTNKDGSPAMTSRMNEINKQIASKEKELEEGSWDDYGGTDHASGEAIHPKSPEEKLKSQNAIKKDIQELQGEKKAIIHKGVEELHGQLRIQTEALNSAISATVSGLSANQTIKKGQIDAEKTRIQTAQSVLQQFLQSLGDDYKSSSDSINAAIDLLKQAEQSVANMSRFRA